MENKGNTRTKKTKRSLKLYVSDNIQAGLFKPVENIIISASPVSCEFSIQSTDNFFEIFRGNSILGKPIFKVSTETHPSTIYKLILSNREILKSEIAKIGRKRTLKVSN